MKNKTYLFVILLSLILSVSFSCKKITAPDEESKAIFGQWNYRYNTGGFSGSGGSTQFNETSWIEFTENGIYKVYEGSKKKEKERFEIVFDDSYFKYSIDFSNAGLLDYAFSIEADTLLLSEDAADGFSYVFVRK